MEKNKHQMFVKNRSVRIYNLIERKHTFWKNNLFSDVNHARIYSYTQYIWCNALAKHMQDRWKIKHVE